ncbi:hypothetical protein HU772_015655 [Pseudomonas xantholysinigenes]|uniref:Uncharacterized protein n=2 Tax=Pseudomonas xantholysinigenes TaxID=2745490 RepID=A0A9E6PU64_9PSED|nr:hypothetical protein HU772_015655 [Pseudomonas xantholysinigenes]
MTRRTDRSMRLLLSTQETQTMRSILKKKPGEAARMSTGRRVLCAIGAAVLSALVALGAIQPDLALAIAKWAGLVLAF